MDDYGLAKRLHNMTTFNNVSFAFQTVGIASTVLALTLLVLTCALCREWRQTFKNQLLIQLIITRFLYVLLRYAYEAVVMFGSYENVDAWRTFDQLLLFYTELAVVSWTFVFSRNMHDDLVKVITVKKNHRLLKISLGCWLTPVPLSVVTNFFHYKESLRDLYLYLLYGAVLKWPVLVANGYTILKIMKSLRTDSDKNKMNRKIMVVMVYLLFVFCIQHFLNDMNRLLYFSLKNDQLTYIPLALGKVFYIASMFQCSYAVIFWLFYNKTTKKFWRKIICEKENTSIAV